MDLSSDITENIREPPVKTGVEPQTEAYKGLQNHSIGFEPPGILGAPEYGGARYVTALVSKYIITDLNTLLLYRGWGRGDENYDCKLGHKYGGCGSPVVKVSDHDRHVMSSSPIPLQTRRVGQ
ncbi:hypothetical protein TNCV_1962831 [Trichonephila clavipes]|nr:hypothetical protein TNCV_1962831 [Trichonephila clavipes]